MKEKLLFRIALLFLGFLLSVVPIELQAGETDFSIQETESNVIVEIPDQMTQKQMNDLFGEDPYLGQTSYLQSPDGFIQRDK
tara:strand:- start:526 stop:771 length:246 start_codon:yes stop_codon:yes gene_type:complete